jgi:hypothetical protein
MPIRIMAIRSLWQWTDFTIPPTVPQIMATIGIQANQGMDSKTTESVFIVMPFAAAGIKTGRHVRKDLGQLGSLFDTRTGILATPE